MFGINLFDAGLVPAMTVALLAGLLSFLSPCVLPIVPPYLAYMSGITASDLKQGRSALPAAAFFVLGLSTVFLLMGAATSAFGLFFLSHSALFSTIAALTVMLFGLHFLHLIRLPFLSRDLRLDAPANGGSAMGAYLLGLAFAFGWTPCIGPILSTILTLAAQSASITRGTLLLAAYAVGLGIPFLLVAAYFPRLTPAMAFLKRHMAGIERLMGLFLLGIGVLMLTGGLSRISYWLLETLPPALQFG